MTACPQSLRRDLTRVDTWVDQIFYLAVIVGTVAAAFLLRFDFSLPREVVPVFREAVFVAVLAKLVIFDVAGLHRSVRQFASIPDLGQLLLANLAASAIFALATLVWIGPSMPRSIWVIDGLMCFLGTGLICFWDRIRHEAFLRPRRGGKRKGILIYGAGSAGTELLREIRASRPRNYEVVGFLDDDPDKHGRYVMGVPVLGPGSDARRLIDWLHRWRMAVEEIFVAMPSASGAQMREALAACRATKLPCRAVPGIDQLLTGKVPMTQVRSLAVTDLLGRPPVLLNEKPICTAIAGRSVLVTGAAGSIGSELCRQIARFGPARLIVFDQAESELFKTESELRSNHGDLGLIAAVGDIRNRERVADVLEQHSVDAVFHAAAYKHVPLMESHLLEAVNNNIFGTWNLVCECRRHRVRNFLMISSDKAVNPTSVMGATKRVCERIVSARRPGSDGWEMNCVSVRFGNVLGSNGSVVPIFQSQIQVGGPVKVTHPDMRRYFMTTAEAVTLVLQAWTIGKGSDIFVLDMGEPVRIVDLATRMIEMAGLSPGNDIEIQFTGMRPGEKLFEEVNGRNESMMPTSHEKIMIFQEPPEDQRRIEHWIDKLEDLTADRRREEIIAHIRELVPEYQPSAKWKAGRLEELMAERQGMSTVAPLSASVRARAQGERR